MSDSRELSGREAILARELGEARAQIAVLREALGRVLPNIGWRGSSDDDLDKDYFFCEFCAASAADSDDIPHHDQCMIAGLRAALSATSADALKQIRAEVLEEAAQSIERKMQSAHHDFTSWQARNLIRALKDKP